MREKYQPALFRSFQIFLEWIFSPVGPTQQRTGPKFFAFDTLEIAQIPKYHPEFLFRIHFLGKKITLEASSRTL